MDDAEMRVVDDLYFDVFADDAANHLCQTADDLVEFEVFHFEDLAAAERQQLARQHGGAFGAMGDFLANSWFRRAREAIQSMPLYQPLPAGYC